jgi:hypothetical protein
MRLAHPGSCKSYFLVEAPIYMTSNITLIHSIDPLVVRAFAELARGTKSGTMSGASRHSPRWSGE